MKSAIESAIEQEIEWHEKNKGKSGKGFDFEDGFIAGLRQALMFEKIKQEVETDAAALRTHADL